MDPEACLDRCESHLGHNELPDALEALVDYWDWRDNDGFEPPHYGDARAEHCALTLVLKITGRCL